MSGRSVLIVDDQRPFRSVARIVVELVGDWTVTAEAETSEDAVSVAALTRPEVVLMDINLPGISGIEATRRLLAAAPATTVVLLSTYAAADLPADAADCGAVAYLRKEDLTPDALRAPSSRRREPRAGPGLSSHPGPPTSHPHLVPRTCQRGCDHQQRGAERFVLPDRPCTNESPCRS